MRHCLWVLWIVKYSCSRTHGGIVGGCRLWMTFCVERHAAAEFVVLRFVFMAEAGFMWSGERCDNTDACLMWATLALYFWLFFRRYAAMFDACLFIYVWQVISWHDLACLVSCWLKHFWQAVCRHVLAGLISENASGGPLPCFGMFVSARWYTDMFWQMVVSCLLEHFWQVLYWVADRTRQDHAKIQKKRMAGLLVLRCQRTMVATSWTHDKDMEHEWPVHSNTKHSFHQLTAFVEIRLVSSSENVQSQGIQTNPLYFAWPLSAPGPWKKLDDNPHLTTPTQHVMVGITRSKVIFAYVTTTALQTWLQFAARTLQLLYEHYNLFFFFAPRWTEFSCRKRSALLLRTTGWWFKSEIGFSRRIRWKCAASLIWLTSPKMEALTLRLGTKVSLVKHHMSAPLVVVVVHCIWNLRKNSKKWQRTKKCLLGYRPWS